MQQNILRVFTILFIGVLVTFSAAEESQRLAVTKMNHTQYGAILDTFSQRSMLDCTKECAKSEHCRSVTFEAGMKTCTTNRWALRNESASECNTLNCSSPRKVKYTEKHIKVRNVTDFNHFCMDPF